MSLRNRYKEVDRELKQKNRPESIVSTYGYDPALSEGALVPPVFLSSTFVLPSAEEGERSFQAAYHLVKRWKGISPSLIYSRLNNPNLEILEDRLTLFENGAQECAVFSSGMAAISTSILSLLGTGESVLYSTPVYGGSDFLFTQILPHLGIRATPFCAGESRSGMLKLLRGEGRSGHRPRMIFLETPANPTCRLTDIIGAKEAIDTFSRGTSEKVYLAVDNTFLGPMWQHPSELGADLTVYSATKFIGGHSDVVAGAVMGSKSAIEDHVKVYRTILGGILSPFDGYLLVRSLDTLGMRMTAQMDSAGKIAEWLDANPKVKRVYYPGLLRKGDPQKDIFDRQCKGAGSLLAFDIKGGKRQAFRLLNSLKLIKLAVSLGSTKTLAEHPSTMTHSDMTPAEKQGSGIGDDMIRISVGTENPLDLIADLRQAFSKV